MYKTYGLRKKRFKNDMRMLYTHTDSLIMQIYTSDLARQLLDEPKLNIFLIFAKYQPIIRAISVFHTIQTKDKLVSLRIRQREIR